MFEENYSYSEIVKKLSRNKGWVRKWTRHWGRIWQDLCKVKVAGDWLKSCFKSNYTKNYLQKQISDSLRKFDRTLKGKKLSGSQESIWRFLHNKFKWRCFKRQKVPLLTAEYKRHVFGNLGDQFLRTLCKILSVRCLTDCVILLSLLYVWK